MKKFLFLILVLISTISFSQKTHIIEYSGYNTDTKEYNVHYTDTDPINTFVYVLTNSVVIVTDTGRTVFTFEEILTDECEDLKCRKLWLVNDGSKATGVYLQIINTINTKDIVIQIMYMELDLLISYYAVQPKIFTK